MGHWVRFCVLTWLIIICINIIEAGKVIDGLSKRLEEYQNCSIRIISSDLQERVTELEPLNVPVKLFSNFPRQDILPVFKHTKFLCSLDIWMQLYHENLEFLF